MISIISITEIHRIIARKDVKQVDSLTLDERGMIVPVTVGINAIENITPLTFVFPRNNYGKYFVNNGLSGSIDSTKQTSCMNSDDFF